ncbi:MAG: NAD-dependent epimerase/dehydratase family protein [bacterium]
MKILVVGGAGFIGSHLVEALLEEGAHVGVIDNFATGSRANLPAHSDLAILERDILAVNAADVRALGHGAYDGVALLAAIPSVVASWEQPLAAHHSNLSATLATIALAREVSIPRLVFASSAAVYGDQSEIPVRETCIARPATPYGLQKLTGERYLEMFSAHNGFSAIALRLFNVFGPRQSPSSPYAGVISLFADRMRDGKPITVFGDGKQTRDFIYVRDAAAAFVRALAPSTPAQRFAALNVGRRQEISLLELIDELAALFPAWPPDLRFEPRREGDIVRSCAEITRARELLGWAPRWSLEDGLRAFVGAAGSP